MQSAVAVDEVSQTLGFVHAGQGDGKVLGIASHFKLHHSLAVGAAVGEKRLNIVHPLKLCHPHWLQTTNMLQNKIKMKILAKLGKYSVITSAFL